MHYKKSVWHTQQWDLRILIGLLVAATSQLYLSNWSEGFRVSSAAIFFPICLISLVRDRRNPSTGLITALCVLVSRTGLYLVQGGLFWDGITLFFSDALFYLCYDMLLCLLVPNRHTVPLPRLWVIFFFCDFLSNCLDFSLSFGLGNGISYWNYLATVALIRSLVAISILWTMRYYRSLLLQEAHQRRYQRLFLMTADLKTELYFLKKNTDEIEGVMSCAYQLYERLGELEQMDELKQMALHIAHEVHEVKKDNLRILHGLQAELDDVYDEEEMSLSDLIKILQDSTQHLLGQTSGTIRLECTCHYAFKTGEHYRLLSILKNLVSNGVEAIQSTHGVGVVTLREQREGDDIIFTIRDNGCGISQRSIKSLFHMGYSTKFDPQTGNIGRGVGLVAVKSITEELGGSISVETEAGQWTQFSVRLPLQSLENEQK